MANQEIAVSKPIEADRAQWEALYRAYAKFYKVGMDAHILSTVWQWIQDADNPFYCLVAKDLQGNLTGLMHFRAMPSPLRGTHVGFLDDLFVRPDARGAGVVHALYTALDTAAITHGWPLIRWITADNNYRARSVYDSLSQRTHWVTYQMDIRL